MIRPLNRFNSSITIDLALKWNNLRFFHYLTKLKKYCLVHIEFIETFKSLNLIDLKLVALVVYFFNE